GNRRLQIAGLGLEELAALAGHLQLLERSQIHGTEDFDRLRQARDLGLQRRGADAAFDAPAQCLQIGARFGQLAVELFGRQARSLLLQFQLGHAVDTGLALALQAPALLIVAAYALGQLVLPPSRLAQRLR